MATAPPALSLADFIKRDLKRIVDEWAEFAGRVPSASNLDIEERRDHAEAMLTAIAADLDTPQTKGEQAEKGRGESGREQHADTAATAHGTDRAAIGFTPMEMLSEFRALRASVLRLWAEDHEQFDRASIDDMTRFNEAIDQALAASMASFADGVERSKDLFLGVLGHDLRNPLGAILMSATSMIASEAPDSPHLKTAHRIVRASTRMDGIISDLLDFTTSRLGSGIPVVRVEIDIEAVCRHVVDELTAFHPEARIVFVASGDLRGQWDAGRVGQLLSNLVGNAREHGLKKRPIEVTLSGEPEHVVLRVHNQGPSIPAAHLKDIFDPFRQLEHSARTAGSQRNIGLGLYIVRAIVVAHHGAIEVESNEQGTTFTVRLPRLPPSPPPPPPLPPPR